MACKSLAIAYPHPRHTRRSARQQSGQHGGVNRNLRAHSPQTSNPPDSVCAFALVTGLRPQNLMTAKTGPFSIPPPGIRRGPPTTFPQVKGPLAHVVAGEGFEPSKLSRWIYSPLPLAARATCLGADGTIATQPRCASNRAGQTVHFTHPTTSKEPIWPTHRSTS